jgi:hypothetical protein
VSVPPLPGAACSTAPDPDIFFPEAGDHAAEALAMALCAGCPARAACRSAAEANGERHGIWGGVHFDLVNGRRKAS